jgi:hypothetical protein
MSPMLATISAIATTTVSPITRAQTRQQADSLQTDGDALADLAGAAARGAMTAPRASGLPPAAPLAPAVMQELLILQANVERDLPGLFDLGVNAKARRLYSRRRNLARAA